MGWKGSAMNGLDYFHWLKSLKTGAEVCCQSESEIWQLTHLPSKRYMYVRGWVVEISDFIYLVTHERPEPISMESWAGDRAQRFCKHTGKSAYRNSSDISGYYQIVPLVEGEGLVYLPILSIPPKKSKMPEKDF